MVGTTRERGRTKQVRNVYFFQSEDGSVPPVKIGRYPVLIDGQTGIAYHGENEFPVFAIRDGKYKRSFGTRSESDAERMRQK